jgi:hypothetical protein
MGCGCKNKGNQQKAVATTVSSAEQKTYTKQVNENVKEAIKKTVEKYYQRTK